MQITKKSSFQFFLLLIAFLLALAFRLIQLGSVPLNNQEANFALQALAVSLGNKTSYGLNMAYVGLTGPDFFVFDATNFLARFWPALFGALAVFIPYLYRQWIGRWPAIALSFILAISPEMVGLSRIIGSPMIAFVCLFLGLGFLLKQKPILSGFLLALSLLSGHSLWIGILIFVVSFLVSERVFNISDIHERHLVDEKRRFWLSWGGAFGVTLILIGTGFFMAPAGLSGIFDGLISFLQGFGTSYTQPYVMLPLTLFAYTMPALILGIWGGIRGVLQHSKVDMFLFLWFILGLILILAYPGSLPADLIWITLPLWILTVRVLISTLKLPDSSRFIIVITLIMVIVVSAFMLLALRSIVRLEGQPDQQLNYLIALVGGGVLLLAIILLISFGWTKAVALPGLMIGLTIVICAGLISVSVKSTGLNSGNSFEWWYPDQIYPSPKWMTISIDRIIDWNASGGIPVDIAVVDLDSPSMRWVLRNYQPHQFLPYLPPQAQTSLLITDSTFTPEIADSYRGQDLVWSRQVQWSSLSPFQYLNWMVTGQVPTSENWIILWVRTDLMPDAQFSR